jgi:hypothetical protein
VNWARFAKQVQTMGVRGHRTRSRLESGINKKSRLEHSSILTLGGLSCQKTTSTVDRRTITTSEDNGPPKKRIKTSDA